MWPSLTPLPAHRWLPRLHAAAHPLRPCLLHNNMACVPATLTVQGDGSMTRESLLFDVDTAIRVRARFLVPGCLAALFSVPVWRSCGCRRSRCRSRQAGYDARALLCTLLAQPCRPSLSNLHAPQVCRQAGYYEHALYVALAAGEPQAYLDVLLEDCKRWAWESFGSTAGLIGATWALMLRALSQDLQGLFCGLAGRPDIRLQTNCKMYPLRRFHEGLEYIKGLPRREAAAALQKYGKVRGLALCCRPPARSPATPPHTLPIRPLQQPPLLAQALLAAAPVEMTAALMGLCLRDPSDPGAWVANMADFTHLYTDRCAGFLALCCSQVGKFGSTAVHGWPTWPTSPTSTQTGGRHLVRCVEIMFCTVWQYGGAWVANMADFTHLYTDRWAALGALR